MPHRPGYIAPNFPNPNGPDDAQIIIYGYIPNFTLCLLGIVLFTLFFFAHLTQVLIYRIWAFTPLVVACIMEVGGYVFRALSSRKDPYRITYFVVAYFLIVTAPVLISASIYVCLTKILAWTADQGFDLSGRSVLLRRKVVLWTFITVDVFSTLMQVTGAGLIGSATSDGKSPSTANNILLAGLALQSAAFAVFLVLLVMVIVLVYREPRLRSTMNSNLFLVALALASVLVFVRTIFRLAETAQGVFGYLSSHEAFFGALEFAPMVVAVGLLAIWFPGRWPSAVPRRKSEVEGV